jgi:hypothetical protein
MFPNTARFSELAQFLGGIPPASYTTTQTIDYVSLANFHRGVILVYTGALSTTLFVDLHEASNAAGTGVAEYDASADDLTLTAADDNTMNVIEIRTEEFSAGMCWLSVIVTLGAQSACLFSVEIWGLTPRFMPVSTAALTTVEDH